MLYDTELNMKLPLVLQNTTEVVQFSICLLFPSILFAVSGTFQIFLDILDFLGPKCYESPKHCTS
jgi:hypothetical protein